VKTLNKIPGFNCMPSDGTFYSFPNVEAAIGNLDGVNDDLGLADYLLTKAEVALVPGTAFGLSGHIRISFATSMENLENALDRIAEALTS